MALGPKTTQIPAPPQLTEPNTASRNWQELVEWFRTCFAGKENSQELADKLPVSPPGDPEARLRTVVEVVSAVNESAKELSSLWTPGDPKGEEAARRIVSESGWPEVVRASIGTLYALWLVHEARYDEALEAAAACKPEASVAPETLTYCRTVAHYFLGQGPEALSAAKSLQSSGWELPVRYRLVAEVVRAEVTRWEKSPLRQASQLMGDSARRLGLARKDPKLLPEQDRILEILDKLIDEASRQRKQSMSAAGGGTRSASPAQESLPLGGKGPGEVAERRLTGQSNWGDLPPKTREEALQAIGRAFPPQYRQIVELYFRRLAEEPAGPSGANNPAGLRSEGSALRPDGNLP